MNEKEPSCIAARQAIERRRKMPHRRRTSPQEVIVTNGEGISLAPKNVILFWRNVVKSDSGCWEWIGSKWGNGYGRIMIGKKRRKAHRISFLIHNGLLPPKMLVCHKCDNTSCVNPDHLFLGDVKANSKDMTEKGRSTHGERNGRAILTTKMVIEIRNTNPIGRKQCEEMANKYGCSVTSIYNARRGATWKRI